MQTRKTQEYWDKVVEDFNQSNKTQKEYADENHIKLPDSECFCKTCGTKLNDIGYTEVRRFEYIPAKIVAT